MIQDAAILKLQGPEAKIMRIGTVLSQKALFFLRPSESDELSAFRRRKCTTVVDFDVEAQTVHHFRKVPVTHLAVRPPGAQNRYFFKRVLI